MQKSLRKLLVFGKEISIFTGILLVLLFVFSCNNMINIRGGGNLIIAIPGARAATASSFTIELTGSNGATQNKPVSGGSTVQFDDLAPDTYTISVKGMDDAGTVVFSGSAKATVVAGETATVTVDLESALGNLTVEFTVPAESTATSFTVEISDSKDFSESKTVSDGTSVQFNDLIPGSYTISVQGMNAGTVVVSGSATTDVVAGETAPVTVALELSLGSLTVNFEGAESVSVVKYNVTLSGPNEFEEPREVESKSVQFDDLAPDTYNIVVEGIDTNNKVVVGGAYSATVTAGASASATVNLVEGVSDYDSLQKAVGNGGTVNILKSIDVPSSLTVGTNVTIQAAYQDVTLKNTGSGNLFTVSTNGNLTIGGGEHTITLDGNKVAQSIISISGGTATLADNGIITNAAASGIKISSSGTFEMTGGEISKNKESSTSYGGGGVTISGGTFNMTGGEISNNESSTYNGGGGITISSGIFNMTGGRIIDNTGSQSSGGVTVYSATFNMTGGTITDNTGSFGGAVSLVSGTFDMSGGSITGNTATSSGGGVSVSGGDFKMSGSATVDLSNDVYLNSGRQITITGEITAEVETVATITPSSYSADTQVLSLGNYTSEVSKFAVTPNPADGSEWTIDASGNLKEQ